MMIKATRLDFIFCSLLSLPFPSLHTFSPSSDSFIVVYFCNTLRTEGLLEGDTAGRLYAFIIIPTWAVKKKFFFFIQTSKLPRMITASRT